MNKKLPLSQPEDPIHQHTQEKECTPIDGQWYFWNEVWGDEEGPFYSRDEAYQALIKYAKEELGVIFDAD